MAEISWSPDSCQCIIHYKIPEMEFVKVVQKCSLHKDKSGKKLFNAILSHHKKFSTTDKKREEFKKILKMGKPEMTHEDCK